MSLVILWVIRLIDIVILLRLLWLLSATENLGVRVIRVGRNDWHTTEVVGIADFGRLADQLDYVVVFDLALAQRLVGRLLELLRLEEELLVANGHGREPLDLRLQVEYGERGLAFDYELVTVRAVLDFDFHHLFTSIT